MRTTIALLALLALALPATARAAEEPKVPADGAPPVTTASGLIYSVLKAGGEGKKPLDGDPVTVKYTGWLPDGKVFDASSRHGGTVTFTVGSLIKGWNEALLLMSAGARWKLTIPPELAYGDQVIPGIPPKSTLVFDLEVVALQPRFDFHPADATKETTTESGLKVQVLTPGQGPKPTVDDVVEIAYAIWSTGGKLLSSSSPAPTLRQPAPVIRSVVADLPMPVLKESAQLLQVGGRVRVEAPPALAWGDRSQPDLPANSVTVWEFELLAIKAQTPCPPFETSAPGKAVKSATGLEVETLAEGTGASPKQGDLVTVNYAGWLPDGTLFDSSFRRGEPAQFRVGGVIEGWNEALKGMKEGGKVRLTIPSSLAYGTRGSPPKIGPNATLIFFVELVKVGE